MNLPLPLPDLRGGGAERVTLDLAHALASLGHRVDLLLLQAEGDFPADAKGYSPVRSPKPSRLRHAVLPLAAHLRLHRPDGLIAMMWPRTVLAPVAARVLTHKTRVAVVEHARAMEDAPANPADPAALKVRATDFAPEIAAQRCPTLMGLT